MITQINVVKDEKMAEYYNKNNKFDNNRGNRGGQRDGFNHRGNFRGSRGGFRHFSQRGGQRGGQRGSFNNRGHNNSYRGSNNRGHNNNNGYNNQNANNNGNIRVYTGQSENTDAPQQFQLGASPQHRQN